MNLLIMVSWIVGFTTEVPIAILSEGVYENIFTDNCRHIVVQNKILTICLSTGLFLFQAVIPMVFIALAYVDIFRGIKTSLRFAVTARAENTSYVTRLRKVTKVAAVTTFVLVVCWLPGTATFYYSMLAYDPFTDHCHPFMVFVSLLAFGNSCVNPCIYVFLNPELRNAFMGMFRYSNDN